MKKVDTYLLAFSHQFGYHSDVLNFLKNRGSEMNLLKTSSFLLAALVILQGCGVRTKVNHLQDPESASEAVEAAVEAEPITTVEPTPEPIVCPEAPISEPAICEPETVEVVKNVEVKVPVYIYPYQPPANALEVTSRGSGLAAEYITQFKHSANLSSRDYPFNTSHWTAAIATVKDELLPYATLDVLAYYYFSISSGSTYYFATQNNIKRGDLKELAETRGTKGEQDYLNAIGFCAIIRNVNLLPSKEYLRDCKHNVQLIARRLLLKEFAATRPNDVLSKSVRIVEQCENGKSKPFFFDDHKMEWTYCRRPLVKYLESPSIGEEQNKKSALLEFLNKY